MSKKTRRDTSQKRTGKRSVNTSEVTQSHESSWKCNLKAQWNIPIPRNGQRDKDKNVQLRARMYSKGLPLRLSGRESACQGRKRCERCRFDPWIGEVPCRREWQPTPVFLPGEFHGQRRLVDYSSWGRKESDVTERCLQYRRPGFHPWVEDPLVQTAKGPCQPLPTCGLPWP